jgi:hypothetical protein
MTCFTFYYYYLKNLLNQEGNPPKISFLLKYVGKIREYSSVDRVPSILVEPDLNLPSPAHLLQDRMEQISKIRATSPTEFTKNTKIRIMPTTAAPGGCWQMF